jgi:hypothetical protein
MKEPSNPKTMLKKEEWGGLTFLALFAAYAFPPYFIYLMTMAALTASSYLWTTHLSEVDKQRFIDFEKEFRKGYKLEKAGKTREALEWYRKLGQIYADHPQAHHLVAFQIKKLASGKDPAPEKPAARKKAPPKTKPGGG